MAHTAGMNRPEFRPLIWISDLLVHCYTIVRHGNTGCSNWCMCVSQNRKVCDGSNYQLLSPSLICTPNESRIKFSNHDVPWKKILLAFNPQDLLLNTGFSMGFPNQFTARGNGPKVKHQHCPCQWCPYPLMKYN